MFSVQAAMDRAAAALPSGADAEPEPWERAALPASIHSDPIELMGAKRALKAFFFRLLPDIKVEDTDGVEAAPPEESCREGRNNAHSVHKHSLSGRKAVFAGLMKEGAIPPTE